MKNLLKIKIAVAFMLSLYTPTAFAATDGQLAATSEKRVDISVSLCDLIMISNLSDFTFANYSGGLVRASIAIVIEPN